MSSNGTTFLKKRSGTSESLARRIFQARVPEEAVRQLPAQSLFFVIKHNGLASSLDLIEMATLAQCRFMLDLDCWSKDSFNEDQFFEWLALLDDESSFELLKKLLTFVDLKLVSLLIARHVSVHTQEEATDHPPAPRYYTPDKGYTWILIEVDDESKHFLLGRLLALTFDTDPELFYQLLAVPRVATPSILEEEAFTDRNRRLAAEGIPDPEYAAELQSPLPAAQLVAPSGLSAADALPAIEPLIYDSDILEPLSSLLIQSDDFPEMEGELSLILNSAIVYWLKEFDRPEDILRLTEKVKGAMNIGLEEAMRLRPESATDLYRTFGLRPIYRLGLDALFRVRAEARKKRSSLSENSEVVLRAIVEGASQPFPEMPLFLEPAGTFKMQDGKLVEGAKAIERVSELECLGKILAGI